MDRNDLIFFIKKWRSEIAQGHATEARSKLQALDMKAIPRSLVIDIASILRRVGSPMEAILLLAPILRDTRENVRATPEETAEFCNSLILIGCSEEALERLDELPNKASAYYLYSMILYSMGQWDYEMALQYIERYLKCPDLDGYDRAVGTINKMACLVALERFEGAKKLLEANFALCRARGWNRLALNCSDLKLQLAIAQQDWSNVQNTLDTLDQMPGEDFSLDRLYVDKWTAIAEALQKNDVKRLRGTYEEARKRQHWETLRSLDYHSIKIDFRQELLDQLWFGTPYTSFRKALEKKFPNISDSFQIGSANQKLDMSSGKLGTKKILKLGSKNHLTLSSLTSDFYRPLSTETLFSKVFLDEYFDPDQAPNKVHVAISRTRDWLKKNGIGIELEKGDLGYQFHCKNTSILLRRTQPKTRNEALLEQLRAALEVEYFSRADVEKALNLPKTTAQRLLLSATQSCLLEKFGTGVNTEYRFL